MKIFSIKNDYDKYVYLLLLLGTITFYTIAYTYETQKTNFTIAATILLITTAIIWLQTKISLVITETHVYQRALLLVFPIWLIAKPKQPVRYWIRSLPTTIIPRKNITKTTRVTNTEEAKNALQEMGFIARKYIPQELTRDVIRIDFDTPIKNIALRQPKTAQTTIYALVDNPGELQETLTKKTP